MNEPASGDSSGRPPLTDRDFVRRCLIALALLGLAFLLYSLADVLLLIFGATLIAVVLRAIADPIARRTGMPDKVAVLIAILLVLALVGVAGWLFGSQLSAQVSELRETLPAAWRAFEARLGDSTFGERILATIKQAVPSGTSVASDLGRYALAVGNALTNLVLVVIAGVFLASEPRLYRRGFLKLFPVDRQDEMASAFDNTSRALRLWLLGQLVSMTIIGVFTWLGLWLVGVPSALMLGLIAGIAEFIPLAGPILSAVPGLLLALLVGPETALWALVVYVGIQQIESDLITPLIQRKAVSLPPVVTLFGVLALGVTFGVVGIVLAAPLTVVGYVLVKQLYVRDTLGQPTRLPGKDST